MENPIVDSKAIRKSGKEEAAALGVAALQFLADDPERLERFLSLSGLGPHNLRKAATEPTFLGAVLNHVAGDEKLLIAFAADQNVRPEVVMNAREVLVGRAPDWP